MPPNPHPILEQWVGALAVTRSALPSFMVREIPTLSRDTGVTAALGGGGRRAATPVGPDQLVGMRLQKQAPERVLHTGADVTLGDASKPSIHDQRLPARHVVQQGVKLGAVANPLPHLEVGARGAAGQRGLLQVSPSRSVRGGPAVDRPRRPPRCTSSGTPEGPGQLGDTPGTHPALPRGMRDGPEPTRPRECGGHGSAGGAGVEGTDGTRPPLL